MKRQLRALAAALATMACLCGPALGAVTFNPFVTSADLAGALGNNATIGFAYAGDKFVGSVYFGTNNNQLYQTNLTGGSVAFFGNPIPGAFGEIYVSSSLGLGGFGSRDVFAGPQGLGSVYHFSNDGTTDPGSLFASGLTGGVRGIAFDPFGAYGGDMIVTTTAGFVYRINSAGVATFLASVGEDAEGLSFAPADFGPVAAGTLVVASEGSGSLRAITPAGAISLIATVPSAEMVSFVPMNLGVSGNPLEGFYAASYPVNIVKADASDFAAYLGDIVVTGETTHSLTDVHWNGSAFVTSVIGTLPNQPEDGIFVTASILNPGCERTNTCGQVPEPGSVALIAAALLGLCLVRRRIGAGPQRG
ncbi:MAG: PEP-CTERM sorting domain-containing protein [Betaproteobacteria bacterium]